MKRWRVAPRTAAGPALPCSSSTRRKRVFYIVLGVWVALCVMWFAIDRSDDSSSWWFYWPMFGSGIAVAITGIVLLGIGGLFGADWERREIDKYLRRQGRGPGRRSMD